MDARASIDVGRPAKSSPSPGAAASPAGGAIASPSARGALFALSGLAAFVALELAFAVWFALVGGLAAYLSAMAAACAFGASHARASSAETAPIFGALSRASALGLALYLVVEPTDYVAISPEGARIAHTLLWGDALALIAAALALRAPALLIVPAVHVFGARLLIETVSGLPMAFHDVYYLLETAAFLALFAAAPRPRAPDLRRALYDCAAFVAIGFHLANYFWSGVAKLALDGGPTSWLFDNALENMLIVAVEKGVAPLGIWPAALELAHGLLSSASWIFNAPVLVLQLLAIGAVAKLSWLRFSAIGFDLLHVGVWIVGGILFWPWIWLNGAILWTLRGRREGEIGSAPKICAVACIGVAGLPTVGDASWLGWYDSAETRIVSVEAQFEGSDEWTPVPLALFGAHAYSVSYGHLDRAERSGHLPPGIPGIVYRRSEARAGGAPPPPPSDLETQAERAERLDRNARFVRAAHRKALSRAERWGAWAPYLRLHHHTSIPAYYARFDEAALASIARYRVVTRSLRLALRDGRLARETLFEDADVVELAPRAPPGL